MPHVMLKEFGWSVHGLDNRDIGSAKKNGLIFDPVGIVGAEVIPPAGLTFSEL